MADLTYGEVMEQFDHDWRSDSDNRDDALEDLKFAAGDQWDDNERQKRAREGRPCLTINRMPQFVSQVANDIRQSRPSVKVLPVDDVSDPVTAEIFEGLVRQIEYRSKAHTVYANGVESGIRCGIGHWRINTVFTHDSTFEQEIRIGPIMDPLSVVWDSAAIEIDRSDARRCYITDMISDADWKLRFSKKGATPVAVPTSYRSGTDGDTGLYWKDDDKTRIAEYWYTEMEKRTLVLTETGETFDITDWADVALQRLKSETTIKMEREVDRPKVYRQMIDGNDFLDEPESWAGQFIPIVPHIGSQVSFDGRTVRSGLIRWAKDSQRMYNVQRSASTEVIGSSPKAPWLIKLKHVMGLESFWQNANQSNLPYLPYNDDSENPNDRPQRQDPPTAPAALWQEAGIAGQDMQETTGVFDSALGARSNETSGLAIQTRDRQGDTSNFHYSDNFKASIQRTGEILVDLIPKIYDSDRIVRLLGPNDEEQFVPINRAVLSDNGEPMLVNDLSDGRFDVRVDLGPSYTTQRVEAQELMGNLINSNPNLLFQIGDIFFKNSDIAGAAELAERFGKLIPAELTGEEGEEPAPPDPIQEKLVELELTGKAADVENKAADTEKKKADAEKASAEAAGQQIENLATGVNLAPLL